MTKVHVSSLSAEVAAATLLLKQQQHNEEYIEQMNTYLMISLRDIILDIITYTYSNCTQEINRKKIFLYNIQNRSGYMPFPLLIGNRSDYLLILIRNRSGYLLILIRNRSGKQCNQMGD